MACGVIWLLNYPLLNAWLLLDSNGLSWAWRQTGTVRRPWPKKTGGLIGTPDDGRAYQAVGARHVAWASWLARGARRWRPMSGPMSRWRALSREAKPGRELDCRTIVGHAGEAIFTRSCVWLENAGEVGPRARSFRWSRDGPMPNGGTLRARCRAGQSLLVKAWRRGPDCHGGDSNGAGPDLVDGHSRSDSVTVAQGV